MVCAPSDKVPRASPYSGTASSLHPYGYGIITLFDWLSHAILLGYFDYLAALNPNSRWFGLLRFRSPLLTESISLSSPLGT